MSWHVQAGAPSADGGTREWWSALQVAGRAEAVAQARDAGLGSD
jgi:hypothetical protein